MSMTRTAVTTIAKPREIEPSAFTAKSAAFEW